MASDVTMTGRHDLQRRCAAMRTFPPNSCPNWKLKKVRLGTGCWGAKARAADHQAYRSQLTPTKASSCDVWMMISGKMNDERPYWVAHNKAGTAREPTRIASRCPIGLAEQAVITLKRQPAFGEGRGIRNIACPISYGLKDRPRQTGISPDLF